MTYLKGGEGTESEPRMTFRTPGCTGDVFVGTFSRSMSNATTPGRFRKNLGMAGIYKSEA